MNHLITYAGFTGPGLNYAHNEDVVVLRALTSGQGSSQAASAGPKWRMAVI